MPSLVCSRKVTFSIYITYFAIFSLNRSGKGHRWVYASSTPSAFFGTIKWSLNLPFDDVFSFTSFTKPFYVKILLRDPEYYSTSASRWNEKFSVRPELFVIINLIG